MSTVTYKEYVVGLLRRILEDVVAGDYRGRHYIAHVVGLLRRVVEGVVSELEMEVEELELTKIQAGILQLTISSYAH